MCTLTAGFAPKVVRPRVLCLLGFRRHCVLLYMYLVDMVDGSLILNGMSECVRLRDQGTPTSSSYVALQTVITLA